MANPFLRRKQTETGNGYQNAGKKTRPTWTDTDVGRTFDTIIEKYETYNKTML